MTFLCRQHGCDKEFQTLSEHVKHQQSVHGSSRNYLWTCGCCRLRFTSIKALQLHIRRSHANVSGEHVPSQSNVDLPSAVSSYECPMCRNVLWSTRDVCAHVMKEHFKVGEGSTCPLAQHCKSLRHITSLNAFRVHLSNYHRGWASGRIVATEERPSASAASSTQDELEDLQFEESFLQDVDDGNTSILSDEDLFIEKEANDKKNLTAGFARLYLELESDCHVPALTVQKICDGFTKLLEENLQILKRRLQRELNELELEEDVCTSIVNNVMYADTMYAVHHKDVGHGPWLCSNELRKSYYMRNFFYVEPVEKNVSYDLTKPKNIYYVSPTQKLEVMLEKPSIQRQLDKSFTRLRSDDGIIRGYTDGRVYQRRHATFGKSIDLFIFQDAFKPTNDASSAAFKHSTLGVYMTLGNFEPSFRSQLDSIQMAMLIPKYKTIFKKKDLLKRAFEDLIGELRQLKTVGIMYKGERIKVVLQFLIGDNLGQHEIGGFIGSFNAEYFCRYCTISKTEYLCQPWHRGTPLTPELYNEYKLEATRLHQNDPRTVHFKGVKPSEFDCLFNDPPDFHVCDPAMPPCIGHDVLSGVLEEDGAAIINHLVNLKWFTYDELNLLIDNFKYHASDLANLPAHLRQSKTKLGGHMVQNWTFIRILPFILTKDRIKDPSDKYWLLYLSLKKLCEYIFAPSLNLEQLAYLKSSTENYLFERKELDLPNKPKGHYINHYADLTVEFGCLVHMSTFRFESLHSFFRRAAKSANNFKNPGLTMAKAHCLYFAYLTAGDFFKEGVYDTREERHLDTDQYHDENGRQLLKACNFSRYAQQVKSVSVTNLKFREKEWILLGNINDINLHVGRIECLVVDRDEVTILFQTHTAEPFNDYGLYKICDQKQLICVKTPELRYPLVQPMYNFRGDLCFSIKHVMSSNSPFI